MSIEFRDGRYFKAVWNFEFNPGGEMPGIPSPVRPGNLLGAMFTDDPERKKWIVVYRFRYYVDDIMDHTSEDDKAWYRAEFESDEDDAWPNTRKGFEEIARAAGSELHVAVIESDKVRVQMEMLRTLPGICVGEPVPKEELAERLPNDIAKNSTNFN
jgi:hypothetical protein